jgi:hypothetical protein
MARTVSKLSQAFYYWKRNGRAIALFWSEDWKQARPWTFEGEYRGYISMHTENRQIGVMRSFAIGPLLIVYYRKYQGFQ